jgi:maltokinase
MHAQFTALARGAPWAPHGAAPFEVLDELAIGGLALPVWLLFASDGASLYFCAVARDPARGLIDITGSALYQRDVMAWLQQRGQVATRDGQRIVFDSELPFARAAVLAPDGGASSNCVTRIGAGATVAMHKVYRQLSAHNHELAATRALAGQAGAVRCLGGYRYERADGASFALGLVTEYIDGEGISASLSRDIRALWRRPDAATADAGLLAELAQWRAFLERFHAGMASRFGAGPAFDMAALCADARRRLATLVPQVRADTLLEPARARRLAGLLETLGHALFGTPEPHALAAAACHGDLHLSHLLWDRRSGERTVIDLSPPAVDGAAPGFEHGSPLLDWVALERALDYVYLDEAALELAPLAGLNQEQAMRALLHGSLAGAAIARRRQAGARWHDAVRAALCGDHLAHPGRARLYCARLLQELDYNYRHRRPYYRCIDLYFLDHHFCYLHRE